MATVALQAQTVTFNQPTYVCHRIPHPIAIDGIISEDEWGKVRSLGEFKDIYENGPKPALRTMTKMAYDDEGLYIAAHLEEPHLWATLDAHDAPLYQENAFEFFIDPSNSTHNYLEYEVNAMGTEWDLFLSKPYRDAPMIAISNWEFMGMKSKVHLSGTLNNPTDRDEYWSVEIFIPWNSIYQVTNVRKRKPAAGDRMRMNFQRVEWDLSVRDGKYVKAVASGTERPQPHYWLWASQGNTGTSHAPEYWGYVQFAGTVAGVADTPFIPDPDDTVRHYLRNLYYRQKEYYRTNKTYARSLNELKVGENIPVGIADMKIHNTPSFYEITCTYKNKVWHLSQDGLIW
jgi:hypothetical protein